MSLMALLGLHLHTLGQAGPLGSVPTNFLYSFFFSALFIFFYLFLSNFLYSFLFSALFLFFYLFSSGNWMLHTEQLGKWPKNNKWCQNMLEIDDVALNTAYWTQKKSGVQISLKNIEVAV